MSVIQRSVRVGLNLCLYAAAALLAFRFAAIAPSPVHASVFAAVAVATLLFTVLAAQTYTRLSQLDAELKDFHVLHTERVYSYVQRARIRMTSWLVAASLAFVVLAVVALIATDSQAQHPAWLFSLGYCAVLTVFLAVIRFVTGFIGVHQMTPKIRQTLDRAKTRDASLAASTATFEPLTETSGAFAPHGR
jgi:uncharacterized membrane protein